MSPITKDEWLQWKSHKVTQEFLTRLYDQREQLKEGMADGQAGTDHESNVLIQKTIGQCMGLKDAIDYGVRNFDVIDPHKTEE